MCSQGSQGMLNTFSGWKATVLPVNCFICSFTAPAWSKITQCAPGAATGGVPSQPLLPTSHRIINIILHFLYRMALNQDPLRVPEPCLCSSQHTTTAPSARLQHHLIFSIKSFSMHPERFPSPLSPGVFCYKEMQKGRKGRRRFLASENVPHLLEIPLKSMVSPPLPSRIHFPGSSCK